MNFRRFSQVIALSVATAILLPAVAEAQMLRFYDPVTNSFVSYKSDRNQRRSTTPDPQFMRQVVEFPTAEQPGTVIIDSQNKFLYYVLPDQLAVRYGVGVGKEGFGWSGTVRVGAKAEWPTWTPPAEMIERRPELVTYAETGMAGGPDNPLGARAMYLFDGGRDTMYRIHGTNEPWSIGQNVSSGCIRMLNEDVTDLYSMVEVGAKVIVL
jgi:lipoprotein-anchoring transpeptidase ErfK/SrfK